MKEGYKETKQHGRIDFPFALYRGQIPEYLRGFPIHWHKDFEIIYIYSGEGSIRISSTSYKALPGDIFLIPPETVHEIRQSNNLPMVYYNILFDFSLLEPDTDSLLYKNYFSKLETQEIVPPVLLSPDNKTNRALEAQILPLIDIWNSDFSDHLLLIKAQMYQITNLIFNVSKPANGKIKNDKTILRIKKLITYINEHYNEPITIEKAAELCNYSTSFFMKYFKKCTGMTFTKYLNDYRLEKAEELLKNSDKNVSEVCEICGFESLSYFIKLFKIKWGYTPHKAKNQISNWKT